MKRSVLILMVSAWLLASQSLSLQALTNNWPASFEHKNVLLRADLNVALVHNEIHDDFRLVATQPTIDAILQKKGTVILVTHLGRPEGKFDPALSTQKLLPWFERRGYNIIYEPDYHHVSKNYPENTIVLLENVRFYPGEQNGDKTFAQELTHCAEFYVSDALGTLHRKDTSVAVVPNYFAKDKKFLGPLIQNEIAALDRLTQNVEHPYVVILGGGKIDTKLPLINPFLELADTIILTPAIVFTFLKAQDKFVGKSLVDDNAIEAVKKVIKAAEQKKVRLLYPVDYQIALDTITGPLQIVDADKIPSNGIGLSIGPKTIELFKEYIIGAKTVFLNAAMGFAHLPKTMQGLHELLQVVAASNAYSVVGGGDSVAACRQFGLEKGISFFSTGGGATLTYLGGQELPGLKALVE